MGAEPSSRERVEQRRFDQLDAGTLYALLRLRTDVFVVEQACAYPELDGRDDEPGTVHLWVEAQTDQGVEIAAYARLLVDDAARQIVRIGRVVTAADHRRRGHAAVLVQACLELPHRRAVLDAQSHLVEWYERFGFVVAGPEFIEDGIPHRPMQRDRLD